MPKIEILRETAYAISYVEDGVHKVILKHRKDWNEVAAANTRTAVERGWIRPPGGRRADQG